LRFLLRLFLCRRETPTGEEVMSVKPIYDAKGRLKDMEEVKTETLPELMARLDKILNDTFAPGVELSHPFMKHHRRISKAIAALRAELNDCRVYSCAWMYTCPHREMLARIDRDEL